MNANPAAADAIIVGGGFYGAAIAVYLRRTRGLRRITLLEQGPDLLLRASYNNQARVHNGYHYPRSFTTAYRSRINLPRFVSDWPMAIERDFTKLYAIARRNSKVTARQFQRFCIDIGASLRPAGADLKRYFEPSLIEEVFLAEEYVFDATRLAAWARQALQDCQVEVLFNVQALAVRQAGSGRLTLDCRRDGDELLQLDSPLVFNCTYSGLNQLGGDFPGTQTTLKHEITEMALLQLPEPLRGLGITVMDGPFFSLMPFPAQSLHTLSHVRYTPHCSWPDAHGINPYQQLAAYEQTPRADRMLRDAARYLPLLREARYSSSLFEVKTVLQKNESDDGRPILFERHRQLPGCYSVLGGKIDNIYDVLEKLDAELRSPV